MVSARPRRRWLSAASRTFFDQTGMQLDCNWRSVSHARTHGVKSLSVSLRDPLTVVCVCVRAPRGRATVHVRAPSSPTGHHGHAM